MDALTQRTIGAAIQVHRALGSGLLESAYEACLCFELTRGGLHVERQKPQPVRYDGLLVDCGYRLDVLVEDEVVLELEAVRSLTPLHEAQLLTYLELSGRHVGLLRDFNVRVLEDGLQRLVNGLPG